MGEEGPNFLCYIFPDSYTLCGQKALPQLCPLAVVSVHFFSSYPPPDSYWVNSALAFLRADKVGALQRVRNFRAHYYTLHIS